MKYVKLVALIAVVGALILLVSVPAMAFHEAAGLKCMACHTMHASEDGSASNVTPANGFDAAPVGGMSGPAPQLLVQSNKTDLCLACHASNYLVNGEYAPDVYDTGVNPATPAGDFDLAATGATGNGHNPYHAASGVIDEDELLASDVTPPGGSGTLWEWSCLSCHRPHKDETATGVNGTYQYRMLRKQVKGIGGAGTYVDVSTALGSTNTHEATLISAGVNADAETALNHNVHLVAAVNTEGNGFGEWCAGCHGDFHGATQEKSGSDWIRHPTYQPLGGTIGGNYTTTYDPTIPVEVNGTAGLSTTTVALTGPNARMRCSRMRGRRRG